LASGDGGGVIRHHAAFHPFHAFLSVRTFFIRPYFFYPSVLFLSVPSFFYRFRPFFIRSVAFLSVAFLSVAFNRAKISQS
jgi:hypothetical protein